MATNEQVQPLSQRLTGEKTQRGVARVAAGILAGMAFVSLLLAWGISGSVGAGGIGIAVTSFLLFTAASAVGASMGFLFGLPRSRYADQVSAGQPASTHYLTNSNLIKVSDWLTTIIIGLGLVNLGGVLPAIGSLTTALEKPLGGATYSGAVGISILIGGALVSFVLAYLWTSIRVRQLLEDAERESERTVVPDLIALTIAHAKECLQGTLLEILVPENATEDSTIATQSPSPGAIVSPGSTVEVTLAP